MDKNTFRVKKDLLLGKLVYNYAHSQYNKKEFVIMKFISFSIAMAMILASLFGVACVEDKQQDPAVETQDTQEQEVQEDAVEIPDTAPSGEEVSEEAPGAEASLRFFPSAEMLKDTKTAEYIVMEPLHFIASSTPRPLL